ncbi:MAG TPA: YdcH family protein [Holophagaceae bacterium]|nr:YdcH family protein [Holophagaceae bacterium]
MEFLRPEIQDHLMKEHFEFKKLMEEHRSADERLRNLQNKARLSAQESVEEVELKKQKLRAKERIYQIVQEHDGREH